MNGFLEVDVKDLIEYIARNLVDDPEQVEVTQIRRGSDIVFKLHVAKEDMGRVIGKQGRIANAIRSLVNVSAARNGKTVDLDIEDPR
jgi:predicted RNA-binding protein YlqC (UPF0109 family)